MEQKFIDTYYDTEDYALSKNDIWLRSRNGNWELIIPMHKSDDASDNGYQKINDEENIRQVFGIVAVKDFASDIMQFGYAKFCELTSSEVENKKDDFEVERKNILKYLARKRPAHIEALMASGVIKEEN